MYGMNGIPGLLGGGSPYGGSSYGWRSPSFSGASAYSAPPPIAARMPSFAGPMPGIPQGSPVNRGMPYSGQQYGGQPYAASQPAPMIGQAGTQQASQGQYATPPTGPMGQGGIQRQTKPDDLSAATIPYMGAVSQQMSSQNQYGPQMQGQNQYNTTITGPMGQGGIQRQTKPEDMTAPTIPYMGAVGQQMATPAAPPMYPMDNPQQLSQLPQAGFVPGLPNTNLGIGVSGMPLGSGYGIQQNAMAANNILNSYGSGGAVPSYSLSQFRY